MIGDYDIVMWAMWAVIAQLLLGAIFLADYLTLILHDLHRVHAHVRWIGLAVADWRTALPVLLLRSYGDAKDYRSC